MGYISDSNKSSKDVGLGWRDLDFSRDGYQEIRFTGLSLVERDALERWYSAQCRLAHENSVEFTRITDQDKGLICLTWKPRYVPHPDDIPDPIHRPAHYNTGSIEVWDFILDQDLSYCNGNAVKYICRAGKKDPSKHVEDLQKAIAYLNREIERVQNDQA